MPTSLPDYIPYSQAIQDGTIAFAVGMALSLFGMGLVLAFYYHEYPRDTRSNKAFVILFLTTVDTVVSVSRLIRVVGVNGGNARYALAIRGMPEVFLGPLFAMLTANTCQAFMVLRIVRFARAMRSRYGPRVHVIVNGMTVFFVAVLVWAYVIGMAPPIYVATLNNTTELVGADEKLVPTFHTMLDAQIFTFMFFDLVITACMTTELFMAKRGYGASDSMLSKLITLCLRNGLFVVFMQAAQVALTYHQARSAWYFFVPLFIGKVHTLTVLSLIIAPRRAHEAYTEKIESRVRAAHDQAVAAASLERDAPFLSVPAGYPELDDIVSRPGAALLLDSAGSSGALSESKTLAHTAHSTPSHLWHTQGTLVHDVYGLSTGGKHGRPASAGALRTPTFGSPGWAPGAGGDGSPVGELEAEKDAQRLAEEGEVEELAYENPARQLQPGRRRSSVAGSVSLSEILAAPRVP